MYVVYDVVGVHVLSLMCLVDRPGRVLGLDIDVVPSLTPVSSVHYR
jgi:hypothetical protein